MERISNVYRRIEIIKREIHRLDQLGDTAFNDVIELHTFRLKELLDKTVVHTIDRQDKKVVPGGVCKN